MLGGSYRWVASRSAYIDNIICSSYVGTSASIQSLSATSISTPSLSVTDTCTAPRFVGTSVNIGVGTVGTLYVGSSSSTTVTCSQLVATSVNVGVGTIASLYVSSNANISGSYKINGTDVLTSTSIGTGVTNSSITTLGVISQNFELNNGKVIHWGNNCGLMLGYPPTLSSGVSTAYYGPYIKSSSITAIPSGGVINLPFNYIVPTGCDNCCGTLTLNLKSSTNSRVGQWVYQVLKPTGLTFSACLTLLHAKAVHGGVTADYTNTQSGTGDTVTFTTNGGVNDQYCWIFEGIV